MKLGEVCGDCIYFDLEKRECAKEPPRIVAFWQGSNQEFVLAARPPVKPDTKCCQYHISPGNLAKEES